MGLSVWLIQMTKKKKKKKKTLGEPERIYG